MDIRKTAPTTEIPPYLSEIIEQSGSDRNIINDVSDSCISILEELRSYGWSAEKVNRIELVLMELVTNAIIHGNAYSDKRAVTIRYILHDETLEVSVSDEGYGLKRNDLTQTLSDDDILKGSGKGFYIICKYADDVYFSQSGKTIWVIFSQNR